MFIVVQNRKSVVNLDYMWGVAIIDNAICARPNFDEKIILGKYPEGRIEEVFKMLLEAIAPLPIFQNVEMTDDVREILKKHGGTDAIVANTSTEPRIDILTQYAFYMPEE